VSKKCPPSEISPTFGAHTSPEQRVIVVLDCIITLFDRSPSTTSYQSSVELRLYLVSPFPVYCHLKYFVPAKYRDQRVDDADGIVYNFCAALKERCAVCPNEFCNRVTTPTRAELCRCSWPQPRHAARLAAL